MAYEYDPRRRRRSRVPPQLRAWVFGRRRRAPRRRRYDPEPRRRRRYARRYDPVRRLRRPGLWPTLSKLSGVGAFIEQVTAKDRVSATFDALDVTGKLKCIAASIVGRITGVGVFGYKYPRTLNPSGMLNKWLGLGLGMIIAGYIPFVPFKGQLKSFGKNIAVGGAIGGLFDQPALQTRTYNPEMMRPGVPVARSVWA